MVFKLAIEAWDPERGASMTQGALEPSDASVDASVELEVSKWRAIAPEAATAPSDRILFVDGVRRIDALVWITEEDSRTRLGLCASYAAGVVEARERAAIGDIRVGRGLFTGAGLPELETDAGVYRVESVTGESADSLSAGIQLRLRELEAEVARSIATARDLIVVDGPLPTHHTSKTSLGYVKSHRVRYLPDSLVGTVVHRLEPGERTPLFLTTTSWKRYSSYLRLPGPRSHPWAGIVRLEISAEVPLEGAKTLANTACLRLPRYASVSYKDPRAPQNLFPIGGLERELRRRLGDASFVHRALRRAVR